mmetsp:Transcript_6279/g.25217  ORF Transcript_6279/g.25217 Transcript_6279/m.25217 type:complete len:335 (+) Transcript_6279:1638-2642(+)
MASRSASGSALSLAKSAPSPLLGLTPSLAKVSPCLANTSLKKTDTTWPKMMGSEIFIMVAFRCTDTIRSSALALVSSSSMYWRSAAADMREASITSPACSATFSLRVTASSAPSATNSIRTSVGSAHTWLFSAEKKSPSFIDATCDLEVASHLPRRCGFFWAYAFTGAATRRSELPSRSTGFTAEPSTLAYLALFALSSSVVGSCTYGGTAKPLALSSAMASMSCGTDADTLGVLMMFARGVLAMVPSAASVSPVRCAGVSASGNCARMRLATEMSAGSTEMPAGVRKRRTIGSSACVASAGASSVSVHAMRAAFLTLSPASTDMAARRQDGSV